MTQHEQQKLADLQAKNTLQPHPDVSFLLDLIRKMKNARLGNTGLGKL